MKITFCYTFPFMVQGDKGIWEAKPRGKAKCSKFIHKQTVDFFILGCTMHFILYSYFIYIHIQPRMKWFYSEFDLSFKFLIIL